jgi:hypothetical protein
MNMKMVIEPNHGLWRIIRDMFDSYLFVGYTTNLKEALEMANGLAERENLAIELRMVTDQGDGTTVSTSQYLYSDVDVLQAILTYC